MNDSTSSFINPAIRPWGLLMAAGTIAAVATIVGFFGRFCWVFDLFSHFRVQYLIGLSMLGVVLFIGRRRRTAALFLALGVANLVPILPLFFGKPAPPDLVIPRLRAMLLNVNTHLGDAGRVKTVVAAADPDILVLEEINESWMSELACLTNAYPHTVVRPRTDNFGIGLFSKLPIDEAEVVFIGNAEVPSILATVTTAHTNLHIVATHPLPPIGRDYSQMRNEQLEELPDFIRSPHPVILLGDLNVTPWNDHFRRLLARAGLRDSSKGFGFQPTWPKDNPLMRIPLDHCLHTPDIAIVDRKVGENVSSDHYPLIVDFTITP